MCMCVCGSAAGGANNGHVIVFDSVGCACVSCSTRDAAHRMPGIASGKTYSQTVWCEVESIFMPPQLMTISIARS